jgi:hypothetical protein
VAAWSSVLGQVRRLRPIAAGKGQPPIASLAATGTAGGAGSRLSLARRAFFRGRGIAARIGPGCRIWRDGDRPAVESPLAGLAKDCLSCRAGALRRLERPAADRTSDGLLKRQSKRRLLSLIHCRSTVGRGAEVVAESWSIVGPDRAKRSLGWCWFFPSSRRKSQLRSSSQARSQIIHSPAKPAFPTEHKKHYRTLEAGPF